MIQKQISNKRSSRQSKNPKKLLINSKLKNESEQPVDHRVLGRQLDLFSITEEVGVGLVLWHPKGAVMRRIIRDFWEEQHLKNGYQLVNSPHLAKGELWKTSGHLDYYAENMYVFEKEEESYVVKPMNCPFHIQIYKSRPRSYRELPIRYAEWGTVYRYERSGTMHGLLRVRGFTQDDAHIFSTLPQLSREIPKVLEFAAHILKTLGFTEYKVELSTRDTEKPEKYMGSDDEWTSAENALARALEQRNVSFTEMKGEAVFYGPKIDLKIVDASKREWQCSTIQFDFNLPKRFNLTYTGSDGEEHRPLLIHRALLGTIERFFGILIEHYEGNFPVWLAPIQVRVLPVSERHNQYAKKVHQKLLALGIRSEVDESSSTINYKIREAESQKIPYMAICGKREAKSNTLSIREHRSGELGSFIVEQFTDLIQNRNCARI
ncbi:MAG: threonine--tRNA ligase [Candidatus Bathyarchaeota archaeon]|nr:MAG: threonine--tRNA ligase [Candidatus Bathyarchaeota archaeon]